MEKKKWYWEDVPFIPDSVGAGDLLRFQGHIFVKSTVVEEMKAKGKFKEKERARKYMEKKRKKDLL